MFNLGQKSQGQARGPFQQGGPSNPFSGGGGGQPSGPTPQQLLQLNCSIFKLADRCFSLCSAPYLEGRRLDALNQDTTDGKDGKELVSSQSEEYLSPAALFSSDKQAFTTCINNCTVSYIQTRQYMRTKFVKEVDEVLTKNNKIYQEFGK